MDHVSDTILRPWHELSTVEKSENCLWPNKPSHNHCLHFGAYLFNTFFLTCCIFVLFFAKMSSYCIHCSISWFSSLSHWTVAIFAISINSDFYCCFKDLQRISLHSHNAIHQSIILGHFNDLQISLLANIFVINMMNISYMFLFVFFWLFLYYKFLNVEGWLKCMQDLTFASLLPLSERFQSISLDMLSDF